MANPKFKMMAIVLDCPNPHALADFYSALLGWEKKDNGSEWLCVGDGSGMPYLLFQKVEGYVPPVWPDKEGEQNQLIHFDFFVDDMNAAVEYALELGATVAPWQPNGWPNGCGIMLDPVGHPFCIATIEGYL